MAASYELRQQLRGRCASSSMRHKSSDRITKTVQGRSPISGMRSGVTAQYFAIGLNGTFELRRLTLALPSTLSAVARSFLAAAHWSGAFSRVISFNPSRKADTASRVGQSHSQRAK